MHNFPVTRRAGTLDYPKQTGHPAAMAKPARTDTTTRCECGGLMHILTVSPIPEEQDHMLHTFHCEKCGKDTGFKFEKSKWPGGP
jgi:hypothetical protein